MNIVLTEFAIDRHFDPDLDSAGTVIADRLPEQFEKELHEHRAKIQQGYAPFCKLLFFENWTDAKTGTLPITPRNEKFLRSGYRNRRPEELPVLARWFEGLPDVPKAKYLGLVLYSKEQLEKEGTPIDADWGVVAILGQLHSEEEPMTPLTAMRNALGFDEGGSAVPIDREAYQRSVEFWNAHATVKVV